MILTNQLPPGVAVHCDDVTGPQTAIFYREVVEFIFGLVLQTNCPDSYKLCRDDYVKPIIDIYRDRGPFQPFLDDHYTLVLADIGAMTFGQDSVDYDDSESTTIAT